MSETTAKTRRPYTFDRVVRIIITIACIAGTIWLLQLLSSVLLPFLVAWLIAYILEPFVQRNKRLLRTRRRLLPIALTLIEVVLVLTVLGVIFIPDIIRETDQLAKLIHQYATSDSTIAFVPPEVHEFLRKNIDFDSIANKMTTQDIRSLIDAAGSILAGGFDVVMGMVNWLLVILYVVFIMLDYDRLLLGFKRLVPPRYRQDVFSVFNDVKQSMNHYFRGQSLIALCVGVLFSIGFLIVGLPLAVVLGLFIGLLNMVPYLQLISIPITTILCLVCSAQDGSAFWPLWWECMAVYLIVQGIQDLILTPKIMGKEMGLNPAIILLSLSVWGALLGFIGLIVALPLTTLAIAYYNRYIIEGRSLHQPDAADAADPPDT